MTTQRETTNKPIGDVAGNDAFNDWPKGETTSGPAASAEPRICPTCGSNDKEFYRAPCNDLYWQGTADKFHTYLCKPVKPKVQSAEPRTQGMSAEQFWETWVGATRGKPNAPKPFTVQLSRAWKFAEAYAAYRCEQETARLKAELDRLKPKHICAKCNQAAMHLVDGAPEDFYKCWLCGGTQEKPSIAIWKERAEKAEAERDGLRDALRELFECYKQDGDGKPPTFGRLSIQRAWERVLAAFA